MGNTNEYLNHLTNEVGIAPATTQEELDLAQWIEDEYTNHGLEANIQEFSAPTLGYVPYGVVLIVMFLGIVLVGIGALATTLIGLLLLIASIALLVMTYMGRDVISNASPRRNSQNVVAMRPADVDEGTRNRPIVILAHYDTPRLDPLARIQAPVKKYLAAIAPNAICAVAVCALIQLLSFIPEPARKTFWVIGIIAALPELVWGIALIVQRFSPYADGAVGNKSSVAAMMSVMDRVCAGDELRVKEEEPEDIEPGSVEGSLVQPATRTVTREVVEEVVGKRHGEAALRNLGILPENCDITYVEPEVHTIEVVEPVEDTGATSEMDAIEAADPNSTRPMEVIPEDRINTEGDALVDRASLSQLEDGQTNDEGPLTETDQSGLHTMAEEGAEDAAGAVRSERTAPRVPDDPNWGKNTYTPDKSGISSVARRASLFDLPNIGSSTDGLSDVSNNETPDSAPTTYQYQTSVAQDPIGTTVPEATNLPPRSEMAQRLAEASEQFSASSPAPVRLDGAESTQFVTVNHSGNAIQDDIEVLSSSVDLNGDNQARKRRGLSGLFGRKKKQQSESMSQWLGVEDDFDAKSSGENIGTWDNFDEDNQHPKKWKGGAARSINLRERATHALGSLPGFDAPEGDSNEGEMPEADATVVVNSDELASAANPYIQDSAQEDSGLFVDPNAVPEDGQQDGFSEGEDAGDDLIDNEALPVVDRELRDAILAMGDDDLKTHDIWFVATGASELGHAGAKEFLAQYRKELRGAFIINLESVGAGELTALTHEGFGRARRADRRLLKLVSSVASDIHLELAQTKRSWADTEVTPLMRRSLRGLTVMGMGSNELPALSATNADTPEAVDAEQVLDVVAVVCETIRRS